jgi:predicted SAM-dependent methyltransferase
MSDRTSTEAASNEASDGLLRLHIGGTEPREGWKILNIQPGPHVDFVGNCTCLGQFDDNSVAEVYASHVYEHLGFQQELPAALKEVHRVLRPGGVFHIGVPDMEILSKLLLHPQLTTQERFQVIKMMFGGQLDPYDFHRVGLTWEFLTGFLRAAGFQRATRVQFFGLFDDYTAFQFKGVFISLNADAVK